MQTLFQANLNATRKTVVQLVGIVYTALETLVHLTSVTIQKGSSEVDKEM
jgi:hypothetical protein